MEIKYANNWIKYFRLLAAVFLPGLPLAVHAGPQVVYVSQAATNDPAFQDGNSWATAYKELYSALGIDERVRNATAENPVEIWIASGTYQPAYLPGRDSSFFLRSHTRLIGGFDGTETSIGQRQNIVFATSLTVLSGDIGVPEANAITGTNSFKDLQSYVPDFDTSAHADNCYNVIFAPGATDITLDELVIFGGNASVSTNVLDQAVIQAMSVANVVPDGGTDSNLYHGGYYAGYLEGQTLLDLDNRIAGGGLCFLDAPGWRDNMNPDFTTNDLSLYGCVFIGNSAEGYGGGVAVKEALVTMDGCYFLENEANKGGAYWGLNQVVRSTSCYFGFNSALCAGGAVHLEMLPSLRTLNPYISDTAFENQYGQPKSAAVALLQDYQSQVDNSFDTAAATVETYALDAHSFIPPKLRQLAKDSGTLARKIYAAVKTATSAEQKAVTAASDGFLDGLASGVMGAYAAVSLAFTATDLVFQFLDLIPALQNNPGFQHALAVWNTINDDFNKYCTPIGWAELLLSAFETPPLTYTQAATEQKTKEASLFNKMPECTFMNCEFQTNFSVGTGGALLASYNPVRVEASRFDGNSAAANAGAVAIVVYTPSSLVSDSFSGNTSEFGHSVMVNAFRVLPVIMNCTIVNNNTLSTNCFALDNEAGAEVLIYNSIFWNNTRSNPTNSIPDTGADLITWVSGNLSGDAKTLYDQAGDGHYAWVAQCEIRNSIIQSLGQLPLGGEQYEINYGQENDFSSADNVGELFYHGFPNVGEGNRSTLRSSAGNSSNDPLFSLDGVSPRLGSPAIDTGNNLLLNPVHNVVGSGDLYGNTREIGTIDIGAVEYDPNAPAILPPGIREVFSPFSVQPTANFIPVGLTEILNFAGHTNQNDPAVIQTDLYVNPAVSGGDGSGRSWANAMRGIPLNSVSNILIDGGVVWLGQGTYLITNGPVFLPPNVSVFGGFSGVETKLAQSDPTNHPTVISGGGVSAGLLDWRGSQNSEVEIHGVTFSGSVGTPAVNGANYLTIVDNCQFTSNAGSGLLTGVNFGLTNCVFQNNRPGSGVRGAFVATVGSGSMTGCLFDQNTGGAATLLNSGSVVVTNCQFTGNSALLATDRVFAAGGVDLTVQNSVFARNSGTVLSRDHIPTSGSVNLGGSQFTGNSNRFAGDTVLLLNTYGVVADCAFSNNVGAILTGNLPGLQITGNLFTANSTGLAPAGLLNISGGVGVQNCAFTGNSGLVMTATKSHLTTCLFDGNAGSPVSALSMVDGGTVVNCTFTNNTGGGAVRAVAHGSGASQLIGSAFLNNSGGAAFSITGSGSGSQDSVRAINCRFDGNSSPGYAGGMELRDSAAAHLEDCEFFQNSAVKGSGGLYATNIQLIALNCTIVSNTVSGASLPGGAGIRYDGPVNGRFVNLIVYGNLLPNSPGLSRETQQFTASSAQNISYSLIQGLANLASPSSGSFDENPGFVNVGAGNLQLSPNSLAVGAGTADSQAIYAGFTTTDLAGNPRLYSGRMDVGAYEYQGPSLRTPITVSFSEICSGGAPVFRFTPSLDVDNFQWQVNRQDGNSFVPLTADAYHSGLGTRHLTVVNPPASTAGYSYRIASTGIYPFASPGVTLPAYNSRVFVNQNATGNNDGTSWDNAFTSLSAALAYLTPFQSCGQIWVAQGTYSSPTAYTLYTGGGVQIYGGFTGTESTLAERNWQLNPTVLQGAANSVFDFQSAAVDPGTVVDGFQITTGGTQAMRLGAGGPTIQNCIFTNCSGYAVLVGSTNANPTFVNCQFNGGGSKPGTAGFANYGRVTLQSCILANNIGYGAFINNGPAVLQSCIFSNNTNTQPAGGGGAGAFRNNGGAVAISDTQFTNNINSGGAGAVSVVGGTATLTRCQFLNNSGGVGGGALDNEAATFVNSSLFAGNQSRNGGAIYNGGPTLQVLFSTIAGNTASGTGGGIYLSGGGLPWQTNVSGVEIGDSIIWGNSAARADGSLTNTSAQAGFINPGLAAGLKAAFNRSTIIQGNFNPAGTGTPFPGALGMNPMFVNSPAGDYHLSPQSPAKRPEIVADIVDPNIVDLDGLHRTSAAGAYERQGPGNPVTLYSFPGDQNACGVQPAVMTLIGKPGFTFQWQQLIGGDFENVVNSAQTQITQSQPGDYTNTLSTNSLTLPFPTGFDGATFRFLANNLTYTSAPIHFAAIQPGVIYVNAAAASGGDGLGWATAFQGLPEAVSASGGCAQIWIAAGTYALGGQAIAMHPGIQLYGGFAGSETVLSDRDYLNNATILQGDAQAVFTFDDAAVNSGSVIDGLQITTTGTNAVSISTGSPWIRNCVFTNCPGYTVLISTTNANPTFTNCQFVASGGNAGTAGFMNNGSATFQACVFANNGGLGAFLNYGPAVSFATCVFAGNVNTQTSGGAGALFSSGGVVTITDSIFTNNLATYADGALAGVGGMITLTRCQFVNNQGGAAGAVENDAAMFVNSTLFAGNHGVNGGAILNYGPTLQVLYSTIADNTATGAGGGICLQDGQFPEQLNISGLTVRDSIIWGNLARFGSGATDASDASQVYVGPAVVPTNAVSAFTNHTVIQGAFGANSYFSALTRVDALFALDPLFVNPAVGDYHLSAQSPALGAGRADDAEGVNIVDLDSQPRFHAGPGPTVGAYDYQGVAGSPILVNSLPAGQTVCSSETASFTTIGNSTYNPQWQQLVGADFVNLAPSSQFQITRTAGNYSTNTLTLPITDGFDGALFRVSINNGAYFSVPARLSVGHSTVVYVNAAAAPGGDGLGWATAFQSIPQALATVGGCSEIWVAAGNYVCDADGSGLPMYLRTGVKIYGGFSGSETNLAQRDFTNNVTRLVAGTAPSFFRAYSPPVPADASAQLDGFHLSGGAGSFVGIDILKASPTIRNCTFENNSALAIRIDKATGTAIDQCVFQTNNAAISIFNSTLVNVTSSTFAANAQAGNGRVISVSGTLGTLISGCQFQANLGSAIYSSQATNLQVSGCAFTGNQIAGAGSAVVYADSSSIGVTNCQFLLNVNTNGYTVAGSGSSVIVERSTFTRNTAKLGAAVIALNQSTLTVNDSLAAGNTNLGASGTIYGQSSTVNLRNDTIADNTGNFSGAGITMLGGRLSVLDSIVWNNRVPQAFYSLEQIQISLTQNPAYNISYSLVEGLYRYAGTADLTYDPLFVNPAGGNYQLQSQSPAIGVGLFIPELQTALDLAGVLWLQNHHIDLGAYSFTGTPGGAADLVTDFGSRTACVGSGATFSVINDSGSAMTVAWEMDQGAGFVPVIAGPQYAITPAPGGNGSTLTVTPSDSTLDGALFRYVCSGTISFTSEPALLTVGSRSLLYVDASAAGGGNGNSWAGAYTSLSSAMAGADNCTTIWMAAGTYPQSAQVILAPGVQVYGGFPSGGALADRNPTNYPTILTAAGGFTSSLLNMSSAAPSGQRTVVDGLQLIGAVRGIDLGQVGANIQNCRFQELTGGAINAFQADPAISNCVFVNIGARVVDFEQSTAVIIQSIFTNTPVMTPAIGIFSGDSRLAMTNCSVGGYQNAGLELVNGGATIMGCLFSGNSTLAAIVNQGGAVTVAASRLSGNSGPQGAAIYNLGGTMTVRDCLLDHNSAQQGGAVYNNPNSTILVINSTLAYNTAGGSGGSFYDAGGTCRFYNSIFFGNTALSGYYGTGTPEIYVSAGTAATLANDLVQTNNPILGGAGVVAVDPLFNNPAAGDFTLSARSPAIGAGNASLALAGETDLTGGARVKNGLLDLGAYESGLTPNPISLSISPQSETICEAVTANFQIVAAVPYTFQWQYDSGGGWTNIDAGPLTNGASAAIVQSSASSTLALSGLSTNLTGWQVRVLLVGQSFATAPATLTVTPARIIYVDASAPSGGDGSSWSRAYNNLVAGLATASVCSPTLWVAQGTYFPQTTEPTAARFNSDEFRIPAGIAVYGGFPSGGGDWSTRDWIARPTILTTASSYASSVVSGFNESGFILDGFTILGGPGLTGIQLQNAAPTLSNLTITNCGKSGLYLFNSPATILNSRMLGNSSQNGGGGAFVGNGSDAVFQNCIFQGNSSQGDGGGLYIIASTPRLLDVLITGNSSTTNVASYSFGSGGIFAANCSPIMINSTVAGNTGGVDIYDGNFPHTSRFYITNSILWGNRFGATTLESQQAVGENGGLYTFANSTIEGLSAFSGPGVVGYDPIFPGSFSVAQAPVVGGDYRLASCSPVLSAGDISAVFAITQDLDGQPRTLDGTVGLGAYESGVVTASPLVITTQPQPLLYRNGATNNILSVVATGVGLTYQWQLGTNSLVGVAGFSGADTATLTITQADSSLSGSLFRCQITTSSGCVAHSGAVLLTVFPSRYYVNGAAGDDQNSGLSWTNAFKTIDHALVAPGDTNRTAIWVAAGLYSAATNNVSSWQSGWIMPTNVVLYGGFAGNETSLGQRNVAANPTILQPLAAPPALGPASPSFSPYASAVFLWFAGSSSGGIDGFTIANAGSGVANYFGASGLTVANCTFTNCHYGVWTEDSSTAAVTNCVFAGNYLGCYVETGAINADNCVFSANTSSGVQINKGALTVQHSSFINGGAGAACGGGAMTIQTSSFTGNAVGATTFGGFLTIQDSLFTGNVHGVSSSSGASGSLLLQRDAFRGNGATNAIGGGISLGSTTPATVEDCLFSGNVALSGGAVHDSRSGSTFRNCTLTGNLNYAIFSEEGSENIVNCLLWNNSPATADATTDPGFAQAIAPSTLPATNGDFHLSPCSPFIGSGNAGAIGGSTTDLDGQPRLFNGTVTPGAYQPQSPVLAFTVQPANAAGSLGQSVSFGAAVTVPAGATYQWQVSVNGGTYSNLTAGAPYSGVATSTLQLAGSLAYSGNAYRVAVTFPGGCAIYSQAGVYNLFLAAASLGNVQNGVLPLPLNNITLTLPGGVNSASAGDQSVTLYGMQSGRSALGFTVNGGIAYVNPQHPFHAGEQISVTVNSNLRSASGASAQPYNWQFVNDVNHWNGTLTPPRTLNIPGLAGASTLAIGDLNGDGSLDLLVSTASGGIILTNDGAGNYAMSGGPLGTAPAKKVVLGDTRGLGRMDVLLVRNGSLEVWTNSGAGALNLATNYTQLPVTDIALGDLNNDGYLDLFVLSPGGDQIWTNDGAGHFVDSGIRLADSNGLSVALGDFNGDGYLDAMVTHTARNVTGVWLNQGGGGFTPGPSWVLFASYSGVQVADVDNDGKPDLIMTAVPSGNQGFVDVYSGLGSGFFHFTSSAELQADGNATGALAAGDLNGDHRADVVYQSRSHLLTPNVNAAGGFQGLPGQGGLGSGNFVTMGDLDGDGALDLAIVTSDGHVAVSFQSTQLTGPQDTLLTNFGQAFTNEFAGVSPSPLTAVTLSSLPGHGTLFLSGIPVTANQVVPAGQLSALSYQGAANYHGRDVFTWLGTTAGGLVNTTLNFQVTVLPVTHQVAGVNDFAAVGQGASVSALTNGATSVLANDLNPDGGSLTAQLVAAPLHGSLQLNADGTFAYTHDGSATHADAFSYAATNPGTGSFGSATVIISITNVNHTPTGIAFDSNPVYEGKAAGTVVGRLSASDSDPARTQFTYSLVAGAGATDNAAFAINGNVLVTAGPLDAAAGLTRSVRVRATDTPTAYDTGGAFAETSLTITVLQAPVAAPQNVAVSENISQAITLSGFSAVSYTVVATPAHGVLSGTAPNLVYLPTLNYTGPDAFTFQVSDGVATSAVATVSLTVLFVNQPPTAPPQSLTVLENGSVNFTLAAAPYVPTHTLTYQIVDPPIYGTLSGAAPTLTFKPATNFHGTTTFDYTATDNGLISSPATVVITVQHVIQAPVAASGGYSVQENRQAQIPLIANDADSSPLTYRLVTPPAHGIVTASFGGTPTPAQFFATYRPAANFSGPDVFTFVANNGTYDSAPATITMTVTPVPTPVGVSQSVFTTLGHPVNFTLIAFDAAGVSSLAMNYRIGTYPAHGTLSGTTSSNLTYTPSANFLGTDTMTFIASETGFDSAPAPVQFVVTPLAPVADAASITNYGGPITLTLQATDPNGLALTYQIINGPTNGVITSTNFPVVGYTPNSDKGGNDSFTFSVTDSLGGTGTAVITLVRGDFYHDPVVTTIQAAAFIGVPITIGITNFAVDAYGDPLTIISAVPAGDGTATFTSDSVTLTAADAGFGQEFDVTVTNLYSSATVAVYLVGVDRRIVVGDYGSPSGIIVVAGPTNLYVDGNGGIFVQAADLPAAVSQANSFGPALEWLINTPFQFTPAPTVISDSQANTPDGDLSALMVTGNINLSPISSGIPQLDTPLVITADPAAQPMRLFQVAPGARLHLENCVVTGGAARKGGAIYNEGTLELVGDALTNNTTQTLLAGTGLGGAIYNHNGSVAMTNSTLAGNIADLAGGIYQIGDNAAATLVVSNSVMSGHGAAHDFYSTNANSGTSTITATLLSVENPTPPWFGPLAATYTVLDNLSVRFPVEYDPNVFRFVVSPTNPWSDAAALQVTGAGSMRTLAMTQPESGPQDPEVVSVTLTNGGLAYIETFTLAVDPTAFNAPVAVTDAVAVQIFSSVTIPVLANDLNLDGTNSPLTITHVGHATLGTVSISGTNVIYHNTSYNAVSDSFTYQISNGHGISTGTVDIALIDYSVYNPDITSSADDGSYGTLRSALDYASQYYSDTGWEIDLDSGVDSALITLTSVTNTPVGPSAFVISQNVVIDGSAVPGATLDLGASSPGRLFYITPTGSLTLRGFRLTGGVAAPGAYGPGQGGAIYNEGSLTLENVSMDGNLAVFTNQVHGLGGAIYNLGTIKMDMVTITNNTAFDGGGIYQIADGNAVGVVMTNSYLNNPYSTYDLTSIVTNGGTASAAIANSYVFNPAPPAITGLPDQSISGTNSVVFSVGRSGAALQLSAVSGNELVVPSANLSFSGTGSRRFLKVSPQNDGVAEITVAVSSGGISFSRDFSLTVLGTFANAIVTTQPATSILATSAQLNASVTPGGQSATVYFEYGPSTDYGFYSATNVIAAGAASVAVGIPVSGLATGTEIHYRAVVVNGAGSARSGDASFVPSAATQLPPVVNTLAVSGVTGSTVTLNGNIFPRGSVTTARFAWGASPALGTTNGAVVLASVFGSQSVSNTLTGLTPGSTYYYTVVATNAGGAAAGQVRSFTTAVAPVATTLGVTGLTSTSATLNGIAYPQGSVTAVRFVWGATDGLGTTNPAVILASAFGSQNVSNTLTGLTPGSTYYYTVLATNAGGAVEGAVRSFTTPAPPVVVTLLASGITGTSATLNGTVYPLGHVTTMSFVWGTSPSLGTTVASANLTSAYGSQNVSNRLTGLTPGTTYYYAVTATNINGATVGAVRSFTTVNAPVVNTLGVTGLTGTSATLNGIAYSQGSVTAVRFVWGATAGLGTTNPAVILASAFGSQNVSNTLTGLTPGATYYYTVLATNTGGTVEGAVRSFTTPAPPVVVTLLASGITGTSATLNGTVYPLGHVTTMSFVWGTSPSPGTTTTSANLTSAYGSQNVSNRLTGLTPGTTYYYAVTATNAGGAVEGPVQSFKTPSLPVVSTLDVSGLSGTSATLNGIVYPLGSVTGARFVWGPSASLGTTNAGVILASAYGSQSVSNTLTGLAPGTRYYYILQATNLGGVAGSPVRNFTTPATGSAVRRPGKPVDAPVTILSAATLADGTKRIILVANPGQAYVIEAASNPGANLWTAISTNVADAGGQISFIDPQSANAASRFYILRTQ